MKAKIKKTDDMTFLGKADSGHWITIDEPEEIGGSDGGPRPMELVLIAFGGCAGVSLAKLMEKMRIDYEGLEMEISAIRREENPKIYTEVHIKFKIWGDVQEQKVKKAVKESQEKYCSVGGILRNSADVTHEYEIIERKNA